MINNARPKNKRLSILSDLERTVIYDLPDFNDDQRLEYFGFTEPEMQLIIGRKSLPIQVLCALQIGYFKAKQFFFINNFKQAPEEDLMFVIKQYFPEQNFYPAQVNNREIYTQRKLISKLY